MRKIRPWAVSFLLICSSFGGRLHAQIPDYRARDPLAGHEMNSFLRPVDSLDRVRFWTTAGTGIGLYMGTTYLLYQTWYKDYDLGPFDTFNDWPQWLQMDKAGHLYSAYFQSRLSFSGAMWTGLPRSTARWAAIGTSTLIQGTIETLDGFSTEWGFSWSDLAANTAGTGLFIAQDLLWQEQRLLLKVGNNLRPHPDWPTSRNGISSNLAYASRLRFGDYPFERFLKDYNNQSVWLSVNLRSFLPDSGMPTWLNVAIGYGAENVYGAYSNSWQEHGQSFSYPEARYRQWFLSLDLYLSRIPTRKRWVRMLLGIADIFKVPAPTLEWSRGRMKWHWLMW